MHLKQLWEEKVVDFSIIIPARGGSKRIPDKNITDLNGRPLIYYAITQSLKVTDEVYVSTNSPKISNIAKKYGAKIIKRPDDLCKDTSKTEEAVDHFLNKVDVSSFAVVQATTPLFHYSYLEQGISLLSDYDSVFSVTERTEYYWDKNGKPVNFEIGKRKRTQDTEKWYCENGAFYITTQEMFRKRNCLYDGNVGFVVMPKTISHEIDTFDDLNYIKMFLESVNERAGNCNNKSYHPDYMEYISRYSYGI